MAKEICISSTPHETRLAILEDDQLTEIYYERENEYTLAGSIYKGRVTRVLPGMQSAFVDLGLERDAFLYVTDFMEEQEDSADFEKVSNGSGDSNGGRREPQLGREPQAGREARESRTTRAPLSIEPEPRSAASGEGQPGALRVSGEAGTVPGDDQLPGTRRWRGRRGRRRGSRSQGPREAGQSQSTERQTVDGTAPFTSDFPIEVESGPTVYEEATSHGGGQAVFSNFDSPSGAPSHSVPTTNQPIVLPGESLSRYGGKPAETTTQQAASASAVAPKPVVSGTVYKPSTLVENVPGWDGGAELPGESLSRHRGKSTNVAASASADIVHHAWEIPEPEHAPQFEERVPQAAARATEEGASIGAYPLEIEPEAIIEREAPIVDISGTLAGHLAQSAAEHQVAESRAQVGEVEHEETHFDPDTASASHRIDPVAPSEYRFSPVLEEEPGVEARIEDAFLEEAAAFAPQDVPTYLAIEISEQQAANASEPVEAAESQEGLTESFAGNAARKEIAMPSEEDAGHSGLPIEGHGVEFSEPGLADLKLSTAPAVDPLPHVSETEFLEDDELSDGPRGFAPGAGTLEEEVIEEIGEEEYDTEPLRAYADEHDLDDLEEETLDNLSGAEISEMVRDAHLEQRIGASPDGVAEEDESGIEYGEAESDDEDEDEDAGEEEQAAASAPAPAKRDGRTERRGGRGQRHRGRPNGGGGGSRRANSQLSDLPIISELLKQGQEILVQIAKEPIAKKGARITSHIALPGRFLVFMPTVNHVGVSRKISSDEERQRLKRILISEKGTASGGFIVRTAADGASEDDLRADIRFLISLWSDIKQRADDGKAPALIYHDLNLIERVLRDQVSANFATIWVDNEAEYERVVRFLNRFESSLVRRVKLYTKETPLFEQFGIQEEISKALKSKVWLKSGGSIVINQTEALVAIDINTGKYVGKTARLEDTILKTNLDAIPEIVRQIRLRDLGGIIVIDFIDMDERKNRHKVMAALEEELKSDRAPSKVLQFNDFGLVAITRKRVKQSLERTLSVQCEICAGTGMVKSPTTVCNEIFTELRKMQKHLERGDVLLRVHPEVVKTLKANNAKWLNELEEMTSKTIIVKSDPALHPEQFDIH